MTEKEKIAKAYNTYYGLTLLITLVLTVFTVFDMVFPSRLSAAICLILLIVMTAVDFLKYGVVMILTDRIKKGE